MENCTGPRLPLQEAELFHCSLEPIVTVWQQLGGGTFFLQRLLPDLEGRRRGRKQHHASACKARRGWGWLREEDKPLGFAVWVNSCALGRRVREGEDRTESSCDELINKCLCHRLHLLVSGCSGIFPRAATHSQGRLQGLQPSQGCWGTAGCHLRGVNYF